MPMNQIITAFAGFFIMLTIVLGAPISPFMQSENWLYFTAFIGFNLFQSSFTGFCPLAIILKKTGVAA